MSDAPPTGTPPASGPNVLGSESFSGPNSRPRRFGCWPCRRPGPEGGPSCRLYRSVTDRRIAGVLGGLAEYLGVEATALRVGFVLASVMFLAGFGGLIVYAAAWALIPEEHSSVGQTPCDEPRRWGGPGQWGGPGSQGWRWGPQSAPWGAGPSPTWDQAGSQAGPASAGWHSQGGGAPADRAARSWALVMAACALAIVWSFGFARWWHSGTTLVWLFVMWVLVGLYLRRRGREVPWQPPVAGTGSQAGTGTGSQGRTPTRPAVDDPSKAAGGQGNAPASPVGQTSASSPLGTSAGPGEPTSPDEVDWVAAQAAAASWAAEQLAAAGVPPAPAPGLGNEPAGPGVGAATGGAQVNQAGPPWRRQPYRPRHLGSFVAALFAGLVLLVVASAVGVALGSGVSLVGGVGDVTVAPANLSQVRAHYQLGVGRLEVDLSRVRFGTKGRTVTASVGVGTVVVVLPYRTVVNVDANSGVGSVHLPGTQSAGGTQVTISEPPSLSQGNTSNANGAAHLTLDARVGVGAVTVLWGRG